MKRTNGTPELESLMKAFLERCESARPCIHDLTRAEKQVFRLVGLGLTNRELAETLFISPLTARTHIKRIHSKLDIDERPRLVAIAHRLAFWEA